MFVQTGYTAGRKSGTSSRKPERQTNDLQAANAEETRSSSWSAESRFSEGLNEPVPKWVKCGALIIKR